MVCTVLWCISLHQLEMEDAVNVVSTVEIIGQQKPAHIHQQGTCMNEGYIEYGGATASDQLFYLL